MLCLGEPERPVFEVSMLSEPSEREEVLLKWNDTARDYPREDVP